MRHDGEVSGYVARGFWGWDQENMNGKLVWGWADDRHCPTV